MSFTAVSSGFKKLLKVNGNDVHLLGNGVHDSMGCKTLDNLSLNVYFTVKKNVVLTVNTTDFFSLLVSDRSGLWRLLCFHNSW